MKNIFLTLIASLGLMMTIGCGGHGGGGNASSPTDPGVGVYGNQCQPWQIYSSVLNRCLDPGRCTTPGYGYNPDDGRCYPGTLGGAGLPTGNWDNGITLVNKPAFEELMKDLGQCRSWSSWGSWWDHQAHNCTAAGDWLYLQVRLQAGNSPYFTTGLQNNLPGYPGSSAFYTQQSYNMGARGMNAQVRMFSAVGGGYYGPFDRQFTSRAYPTQNGFELRVRAYNTAAYNERITFKFTYLDSAASQLHAQVIYQGQVIAEGDVVKK